MARQIEELRTGQQPSARTVAAVEQTSSVPSAPTRAGDSTLSQLVPMLLNAMQTNGSANQTNANPNRANRPRNPDWCYYHNRYNHTDRGALSCKPPCAKFDPAIFTVQMSDGVFRKSPGQSPHPPDLIEFSDLIEFYFSSFPVRILI